MFESLSHFPCKFMWWVQVIIFSHTCHVIIGHSRGFGFVEFAHNRATLEQVRQRLNGSTLECSILYCDLVPDTVLSYSDTLSTTLYCVCESGETTIPSSDPQLRRALQQAHIYSLVSILLCVLSVLPTGRKFSFGYKFCWWQILKIWIPFDKDIYI